MRARILYIEDNEDNVYMLARRLRRRGYEVVVASDGEKGVEMARADAPSLILMDLSLPVLDGWAATRELKAAPETRHVPVIAISAHAMEGDRESALAAGCDDYDTKPVECCFSQSVVESPRQLVAVFRSRISWDDGAIRERAGAVAFLMNRCCRSGEAVGARAPSVGKRWGSEASPWLVHTARRAALGPQDASTS